jgi:hypothetical protein
MLELPLILDSPPGPIVTDMVVVPIGPVMVVWVVLPSLLEQFVMGTFDKVLV